MFSTLQTGFQAISQSVRDDDAAARGREKRNYTQISNRTSLISTRRPTSKFSDLTYLLTNI